MAALRILVFLTLALGLLCFLAAASGVMFSPLVVLVALIVCVLAQAYAGAQVYVHASARSDLYAGIPAWVWGVWTAALPVVGLLLFWFLHDARPRRG